MAVIAFVRPSRLAAEPGGVPAGADSAEAARLRLYGVAMRLCFLAVLASWLVLQAGCLLSMFLHFRSGIVAGTIDGTLAFRFRPPLDYFSPEHALSKAFVPRIFPAGTVVAYGVILALAAVPFCASLSYLARLFGLYSRGEVFTQRNATAMRRAAHSMMATGYSPLLLGPAAHAIGVLKPVTGITGAMIAFVLLGVVLLALSHVMRMGQRMRQDQEEIL